MFQKRFRSYSIKKRNHYKFNLRTISLLIIFNPISIASYSEIHLIISGSGTQYVINSGFSPKPSEIYVEGIKKAVNSSKYVLEGGINNIN